MKPGQMDVGLPDTDRRRFWLRFWLLIGAGVAALGLLIAVAFASGLVKLIVNFPSPPGRILVRDPVSATVIVNAPAPAPTPTIDDQGRSVTVAGWRIRPAPEFPEKAQRDGVEAGSATLLCAVTVEGRMNTCELVDEDPPGEGFGQAALISAGAARLYPATIDGVPQTGQTRLTVRFRLQ